MYLIALDENSICDIYVPIPAAVDINLKELAALEQTIKRELQCDQPIAGAVNFNVAVVDPNTTIIYYKLSGGLFDLDSTEVVRQKACAKN